VAGIITNTSGGKTSMCQAITVKDKYMDIFDEQICVFANTGLENEETLEFVDKCDKHYGLNIVWLEAVVHGHNEGNTHRITNFEDAYRIHQYKDPLHPFHSHVRKNGVPNQAYPQCSDRLKEQVIESYRTSINTKHYKQALGFRADEPNRVCSAPIRKILRDIGVNDLHFRNSGPSRIVHLRDNPLFHLIGKKELKLLKSYSNKLNKYNLVFPICDWFPMNKEDVNIFWEDQPFNLELEEHEGNCATCWKKSDRKLYLLAKEHPERFEAFKWFESEYMDIKDNEKSRLFFRGHRSAEIIIGEAEHYDAWALRRMIGADNQQDGCSSSCNGYDLFGGEL
jgi:3'-phosphoadenosine 5'-phosphosulfate sulfotransferase (PAPS reductase)/FAD synthetase